MASKPSHTSLAAEELLRCLSDPLDQGAFGLVYTLENYPSLAAKEFQLDGFAEDTIRELECKLNTYTKLIHPNVLRCHQVLRDGELIYTIVDRYKETVERMIIRHKRKIQPIPEQEILLVLEQAASGLAYLHDSKKTDAKRNPLPAVVHGALEPSSILVSDGVHFALANYGIPGKLMQKGSGAATSYSAPETLLHGRITAASDIWALGVIVYELAALNRPNFVKDGDPQVVFTGDWRPNLTAVKSVHIKEILGRILVPDPEARPSAKELVDLVKNPMVIPMMVSEDLRTQMKSLKQDLKSKSNDFALLKSIIEAQSSDLAFLKKELRAKLSRIDKLEAQCNDYALQMQSLKNSIEQQRQQFNKATEEFRTQIARGHKLNNLIPINDSSWTPLMRAAVFGDIEAAKQHLSDKDKKNNRGETALILAARMGNKEIVEILDPTDKNGVTALMRAAARGDAEMMGLLAPLQKGMKDKDGNTAFVHALKNKHIDVATLLRKHEAPSWTLLMCAAFIGDIELAKSHLSDKDKKNGDGDTALMIAARMGHVNIVELLDPTDGNGVTALMRAADRNDMKAAKLLMPLQKKRTAGGMEINGLWISRGTALIRAAAYGHTGVVRLLAEHENSMKDAHGRTALIIAAAKDHVECVRLLIGYEGGLQDNCGSTALMHAVYYNHVECAILLVKKEKNMKTTHEWHGYQSGLTALDIAKNNSYKELVCVLSK